ncbi:MAG: O-antigen ligase family protein [Bauldia sp.]|nr:O-antigen ligase family protein [Bauldia sp.]
MPFLTRRLEAQPGRPFTIAAAFLVAFGFLPLPFGSVASLTMALCALIALAQVATRTTPLSFPPPVRFAVVACLLYFAVDALSAVIYQSHGQPLAAMGASLQFAFFPLMLAALGQALAPHEDPIRLFVRGARIGAILALILAVIEALSGVDRPRGGMINPIPFGSVAALFAFVSLIGIDRDDARGRILAGVAFTSGLAASFLSQSRGGWIALPVFVVIFLAYLRARLGTRALLAGVAVLAALTVIAVAVAGPTLRDRMRETIVMFEVSDLSRNDPESRSLDQRVLLWIYGWKAFKDRPVLGYGPEQRVEVTQSLARDDGYRIIPFGHLHNEFLTEAVSNGIVGLATLLLVLAAPVVTALRSARDSLRSDRIALAALAVAGAGLNGLTALAFGHDILNTVYVGALLAVALSASWRQPG